MLDEKFRDCWGLVFWKLPLHCRGATSAQASWSLSGDMLPGLCFLQKKWETRHLCELSLKYSNSNDFFQQCMAQTHQSVTFVVNLFTEFSYT